MFHSIPNVPIHLEKSLSPITTHIEMGEVVDLNSWKCCSSTVLWTYVAEHLIAVSLTSSKGTLSLAGYHTLLLFVPRHLERREQHPSFGTRSEMRLLLGKHGTNKASFYIQWLRWMGLTLMSCSTHGTWPG